MEKSKNFSFLWIFLTAVIGSLGVEVHFENKDGGFFLRHFPKQHIQTIPDLSGISGILPSGTSGTPSSVLSVDRFTVFQSSQPISIRATYGPFSTKQTVPARYIVPDPLESIPIPEHNATATTVDLQELVTHHLDMSAHIVRNEVPRDSPVLRVLFHTGSDPGGRRQMLLNRHQRVCIVLHATLQNERKTPLSAACSPEGEDGVCLAQITIPSDWWPDLPPPDINGRPGKPVKTPPRLVQVAYSVLEPRPADGEGCAPRLQIQPVTILGVVPLVPAKAAYKELRIGEILTMLVPHPPLFPLSRMHIPVFMERERSKDLTAIVIRARVKSGIRILSATPSTDRWNITVGINPKHTGATVTALRREPQEPEQEPTSLGEVLELFSWLIEMSEDSAEIDDGAKIVWSTRFEPHAPEPLRTDSHRSHHIPGENRKPTTILAVQKDDIQAVVPISKNWEIMNTAVLTGRQVSQAMKVFIVSQAGKAADVTLQSSCHSEDESVLKVSSSCSSVYVDGSEARGSVNGSISVKYGTFIGLAKFTVWMPEFPLDLSVPDVRLSQIKGWKVPDYHSGLGKNRKKRTIETPNKRKIKYTGNELPEGLGDQMFEEIWSEDDVENVLEKPKKKRSILEHPDMVPDILEKRSIPLEHPDMIPDILEKRSITLEHPDMVPDILEKRSIPLEHPDMVPDILEKRSIPLEHPDMVPDSREKRSIPLEHPDMIPDVLEKRSIPLEHPDTVPDILEKRSIPLEHSEMVPDTLEKRSIPLEHPDMIPDILEKRSVNQMHFEGYQKPHKRSHKHTKRSPSDPDNSQDLLEVPQNQKQKDSKMNPEEKISKSKKNQKNSSTSSSSKNSKGSKSYWKLLQDQKTQKQILRNMASSRPKRSYWTPNIPEEYSNGVNERPPCRVRFQQSPVDVYAHFVATDHDSGRVTYFVNRRTWLRVTDLVLPLLRVSDPKIASLHGRILQGRFNGRAEVQVLSPITGRVIGAKEVRVSNDKVSINKLAVRVVSGLQLNISPDSSIENGYIAETSVTRRLTAQYQEGLLDIELEFSDGHRTPLRDISDSDYHLVVKSLDTEVVAFAPMVASHHPRVIAVGEGRGDLLEVQLLLNEDCRGSSRTSKVNGGPLKALASAAAAVEVDFSVSEIPHRPDFVQNDFGGKTLRFDDLSDILSGIPMKDATHQEPSVQARQHHSLSTGSILNHNRGVSRYHHFETSNLTPLEIGMYVLLAAFCFAIVVFVVSCVVYASKFKPVAIDAQIGASNGNPSLPLSSRTHGNPLGITRDPRKPRESTQNAHDWVWLGRATLERGSGQILSNRNSTVNNNNPSEMRITANPMSLNYQDPDDLITQDNFQESPESQIDSRTYCKRDRNINAMYGNNGNNNVIRNINRPDWDDTPPPLPPHGIPQSEDYKPPVPPHRNIGVTAKVPGTVASSEIVTPPPRRHQKSHHRTKSSSSSIGGEKLSQVLVPKEFEFEDAPISGGEIEDLGIQKNGIKNEVLRNPRRAQETIEDLGDNVEFVQNGNVKGNSPEVKRATIIGNPMFSSNSNSSENQNQNSDLEGPAKNTQDLPNLEDLQLEMDYDQIMHYFDNLKESNA